MKFNSSQVQAARQLLLPVLDSCAPDEVQLVEAFDGEQNSRASRGVLAVGLEIAVPLLLPVLWSFLEDYLGEGISGLSKKLGEKLAEYLLRNPEKDYSVTLDAEKLRLLRDALCTKLQLEKMEASKANRISDVFVRTVIENPELLRRLVNSK